MLKQSLAVDPIGGDHEDDCARITGKILCVGSQKRTVLAWKKQDVDAFFACYGAHPAIAFARLDCGDQQCTEQGQKQYGKQDQKQYGGEQDERSRLQSGKQKGEKLDRPCHHSDSSEVRKNFTPIQKEPGVAELIVGVAEEGAMLQQALVLQRLASEHFLRTPRVVGSLIHDFSTLSSVGCLEMTAEQEEVFPNLQKKCEKLL